jgi:hypothetical protein
MNNNTTTTNKLEQGYAIYKYHHLTDSWTDIGEFYPAANDKCCWFANVRLWNKDTGFEPSTFIDNQVGKYWVVTLEDDAEARKNYKPKKVIPTNIPTSKAINFAL